MSTKLEDILQKALEAKEIQDLTILKQCGWVGNKLFHWEGCECDWSSDVQRDLDNENL